MKEQIMLGLIAKALRYSEINGQISNTDSDEVYHKIETLIECSKSSRRASEAVKRDLEKTTNILNSKRDPMMKELDKYKEVVNSLTAERGKYLRTMKKAGIDTKGL